MKHREFDSERLVLQHAITQIFEGPLSFPGRLHIVPNAQEGVQLRVGVHCHDAWEVFAPLRGQLLFESAGSPPIRIDTGHLLIVPPGTLHFLANRLQQPDHLRFMVMNLPGDVIRFGGIRIGTPGDRKRTGNRDHYDCRYPLSNPELSRWQKMIGMPPPSLMEAVQEALQQGPWGTERAIGLIRILLAAFMEICLSPERSRGDRGERCIAHALTIVHAQYYETDLSVGRLAAETGVSPSHFTALFRHVTGQSFQQMLIQIRLQRAETLLQNRAHTIKEVASLTGWNSPFYFSTVFHRHYGTSPSAFRAASLKRAQAN